ncbi:DEAD/DEAH box helicase [Tessaracoccus palaemonis]|uniref:DEAD/DEAH box helicase n=1 Tax=Tessaracoccus palaemonis TaxID=2829499 RepID=A0ABX8SFT1_9ACTN|nr:DEAD/DEAH box helicase [Tessaracoccus palaemonis]QXT62171.1 DEAD/DEAH box helicase [Tessaracoccus palaemonis]
MSSSALEHLSPAFPQRAAWGTASSLRAWQQEALDIYERDDPRDFLCVATPGAGKTTFALRIALNLLRSRTVRRIVVVAPTEHLKVQWADAAARVGIQLDPGTGGSSRRGRSKEYDGSVVTYAGVAARSYVYEALCHSKELLVIFDEIHHAGDSKSWGEAISYAFTHATRRLSLTGTPFRSDDNPIPFVAYDELAPGVKQSRADYTYGYSEALADSVVRPVLFMNYGGPMRWRTKSGDELAAELGVPMTKDLTAAAWRTALSPTGEWVNAVLRAADTRLTEVRRHVPDAGGLVIATNQTTARAYARLLADLTGVKPCVVLSDDALASSRIDAFSGSDERWMVAVRMVSEGVDVPRLAVGVYATATSTPLFFAQAVGRFVRSRRKGEVATVFLPTVPVLLAHASTIEKQRDHVLGRPKNDEDGLWAESEALMEAANSSESASDDLLGEFEALESHATFDHVLFDAQAFGMHAEPTSQDEADYLGLPGLLDAGQVRTLLADRQRRQVKRHEHADRKVEPEVALHRAIATKRKELNSLVSQYANLKGVPHSHVHADLRRECGGPKLAQASSAEVDERITAIRGWLRG